MIELKLEQMLEKRGVTAYALAKQTGLHQSVLSKLKSNSAKALRLDVLNTLCAALDCQPGDLLIYEPETSETSARNEPQTKVKRKKGEN